MGVAKLAPRFWGVDKQTANELFFSFVPVSLARIAQQSRHGGRQTRKEESS